ncbi:uncharacterized protein PAC_19650 [Phialocephala subalpina]|uniref:Uncharacterized protein n=1 Tax=Phialocephala subalpina TaxID=576137 RepID=A0A1L7XXL8_9HELO|nr:uncharacterized protein PAC_19650 [Phialocephala subalpina]
MAPVPIAQSLHHLSSLAERSIDSAITATRTLPSKVLHLLPRQNNPSIIPTTYHSINSGPAPGTVVGIVLGSVGGFLLLLWLLYTCLSFGGWSSRSSFVSEDVVVRDRRKSHHGSTRSRRVSETVEVRRGPSPVRIVPMPMPMPMPREPVRETVIVEEHRSRERQRESRGSDEVVVIEEHSPPRRKKSVRDREERERRESGYRTVDPGAYGGAVGGRKSGGEGSRRGSGR